MPFGCLLDAFWLSLGCLLGAFWMPFGILDVPGVHFGEFVNFNDFWNVTGVKSKFLFDTIWALSRTFRGSFFCQFFGCVIFSHFAVLGSIWGPILELLGCLGTLEIGLKR